MRYVRVALDEGVKVTLFVTGKCVEENGDIFAEIKRDAGGMVEFGGHTYSAFIDIRPAVVSKAVHLLFKHSVGSLYGPAWYQRRDIMRTIKAFERVLGIRIRVWRTHFYASNRVTYRLLNDLGFIAVSDKRLLMLFKVKRELGNLWHVYITAPPDGVIDPNDPTWNEEWKESFWNYVRAEADRGASMVFNLHPKRMAMLDDFSTFRSLLRFLADRGYRFVTMSEAVTVARHGV